MHSTSALYPKYAVGKENTSTLLELQAELIFFHGALFLLKEQLTNYKL